MVEKLPIEIGLASKIYGLAYNEPVSGYQLANWIGTQPHHVNAKIKELYNGGYLRKITNPKWRWPKWRANVKALVKKVVSIKESENIQLTKLDQEVLLNRLSSKYFRDIAQNDIKYHLKQENNVNSVDEILSFFEMLILLMSQSPEYIKECIKITNKEQYEKAILEVKNEVNDLIGKIKFKKFADNISDEDIPKAHKEFEKRLQKKLSLEKFKSIIQQFRDSEQLSLLKPNTLEDVSKKLGSKKNFDNLFINSFVTPIPKNLLQNYLGISSFGRKYLEIEKVLENVWAFRELNLIKYIADHMDKNIKKE